MAKRVENMENRNTRYGVTWYPKGYFRRDHDDYFLCQPCRKPRLEQITCSTGAKILISATVKHKETDKTLRDLAEDWLAFKKENVKEATYVRYRHLYEKHIDPQFGAVKLRNLDVHQIGAYICAKQKSNITDGLAPKTIQDIMSVYRLIVNYGVEKKHLPAKGMTYAPISMSSRTSNIKSAVLMGKERIELERYILEKNTVRHFGIFLALYTGIRIGELCALRWCDVDLNNGILHINHTLQRLHDYSDDAASKTRVVLSAPKTKSSIRLIPLSSFLVDKLSLFVSSPDCFILTDTTKPEETRSYLYFYKKQLSLCGLPEYTFHAIRHTFATRCVEEGIDIKSLSEILGHANVKITMNRYVHPSIEIKRRHLEKLAVPV